MRNKLITIVIPIYNVEKYLNHCIESVVNQTYTNLQIVLVDDGSTDLCPQICEEWKLKDSRIDVIHQKNGGLSVARNSGIDIAKGEFISFIDSDDFVDKDYIEYLYKLLEVTNADMSVCQRRSIDESGKVIETHQINDKVIKGNSNCMLSFLRDNDIDTVAWAKLYRTLLFEKIRYPEGKYHEDVFTTYKLIAQSDRISVGGLAKYNYLIRKNSISNQCFLPKHLDSIEGKQIQQKFIEEHYPRLISYANKDIIYACNNVLLKMMNSNGNYLKYLLGIQKLYRKYEIDFLKGNSSMKAKAFSVFAYINSRILVKIGSAYRKQEF